MKSRFIVVTGTDTGVGKTTVTRGILRLLVTRGFRPMPLKLVETGCPLADDGSLDASDGRALARAAGRLEDLRHIAPIRFNLPAAPSVAADSAGVDLSAEHLFECVRVAESMGDPVVLEGAGGWLVPFTRDRLFGDLIRAVEPIVVLVARDALGTLNHSLLTLEAIRCRGMRAAGIVLNATGAEPAPVPNRAVLAPLATPVAVWGPLPWLVDPDDDTIATALENVGFEPMSLLQGG